MRRLHLRTPSAIYDPQAGNGAAIIVSLANLAAKTGVPDLSANKNLLDLSHMAETGYGAIVEVCCNFPKAGNRDIRQA